MTLIRGAWTGARVVFDGQSLNLRSAMLLGADPYPVLLMYGRGLPYAIVAESGKSWTNLLNGTGGATAASTRCHPQADNSASKTILILCGGQTDINNEGDSAATIMSDIVAYAQAAKTAGFTHVIATTIPGSSTYDAGEETIRDDFNTLLIADAGGDFDGIVDLTGTSLDTHNGTDFWDTIHFSSTGAQKCADEVATVLDTVLAL